LTIAVLDAGLRAQLDEDRRRALGIVPVSRETAERFDLYVALLARWRKATNLIAESTFPFAWTRHIADSAQLLALAPQARRWVDLGSGAGFPGMVLAIQLVDLQDAVVHCIESDRRKCAFLREVARATGARAQIHAARVEEIDPQSLAPVDAVVCRAFAPLPQVLGFSRLWLQGGAVGIFPRGRSVDAQLAALTQGPELAIETLPSVVDAKAEILRVRLSKAKE
jgi:16S rRNA (guanine527-N7)-methyltransferase